MLKMHVVSRHGSHLQQLACYRKFASLSPVQASIEPHPEVQGVYTLTLNRPEAKNSLGHQLMKQLRDSLQAFKHQRARCLLINSAVEGTFCAGADLKVYLLRNRLLLLPPKLTNVKSSAQSHFCWCSIGTSSNVPRGRWRVRQRLARHFQRYCGTDLTGVHCCCTEQLNTNCISQRSSSSSSACMPDVPRCSLTCYSEL